LAFRPSGTDFNLNENNEIGGSRATVKDTAYRTRLKGTHGGAGVPKEAAAAKNKLGVTGKWHAKRFQIYTLYFWNIFYRVLYRSLQPSRAYIAVGASPGEG